MSGKRRRFSGELKAKIALETLRGDRTLQEIAVRHLVLTVDHLMRLLTYAAPSPACRRGREELRPRWNGLRIVRLAISSI